MLMSHPDTAGARHSSSQVFPAISEGNGNGLGSHEPDSTEAPQQSHEAVWQRMADSANGWPSKANGIAPLPPSLNGHVSAAASPERQVSPGDWPLGLPASQSEGLLSEWTRGSFGSQSGKLFGLEASYSSEDLLAAFQTELDRSPRKLAKASNGSDDTYGGPSGRPLSRHFTSSWAAQHHD